MSHQFAILLQCVTHFLASKLSTGPMDTYTSVMTSGVTSLVNPQQPRPVENIPPTDFGKYLVDQMFGNSDDAIEYLETVVQYLKNGLSNQLALGETVEMEKAELSGLAPGDALLVAYILSESTWVIECILNRSRKSACKVRTVCEVPREGRVNISSTKEIMGYRDAASKLDNPGDCKGS